MVKWSYVFYKIKPKFNWLSWLWWRRTGCYYFDTCNRCIKPLWKNKTLCNECNKEVAKFVTFKRKSI